MPAPLAARSNLQACLERTDLNLGRCIPSENNALNCPCGSLVYGRHYETRDFNCHLLDLAGLKQIKLEPIVCESDENGENGL